MEDAYQNESSVLLGFLQEDALGRYSQSLTGDPGVRKEEVLLANHQLVGTSASAWPGIGEDNFIIVLHYVRLQRSFHVEPKERLETVEFPKPPKGLTNSHNKGYK